MAKRYIRGREGVLASNHQDGDQILLSLDDAESTKVELPKHWKVITPYTSVGFDKKTLLDMELPEEDYAKIGISVMARLVAFWKAFE